MILGPKMLFYPGSRPSGQFVSVKLFVSKRKRNGKMVLTPEVGIDVWDKRNGSRTARISLVDLKRFLFGVEEFHASPIPLKKQKDRKSLVRVLRTRIWDAYAPRRNWWKIRKRKGQTSTDRLLALEDRMIPEDDETPEGSEGSNQNL
jgi:hypothetical protein